MIQLLTPWKSAPMEVQRKMANVIRYETFDLFHVGQLQQRARSVSF